ncbi:hypothetical protein HF908_08780 [Ralstonia pseudosolanacearum]|uniref:hypothetical protein n=1 Tax=Ralstonia pseudosolanacearum TaxID=1310165 RepID=UPI0008DA96E8|nr:hypothetical protein [Ralstonia pseudosolanacearum]MCL1618349.1 hypothetical protein [Ralstonia pseudosolanacearum CaRs-Mep]QOK91562.1 hypothetical protein HF908_08780 [Ralstonia pseudosolanacearum]CAH0445487.1 hypothetical protein LMG10661_01705 [Ralstonia syzygii subsp. syzygii]
MPLETEELRILGRIEGKLDAQTESLKQCTDAVNKLEARWAAQMAEMDRRVRALEIANPGQANETLEAHAGRISALERSASLSGAIAGAGASIGMAVIVEYLKRKIGL